MHRWSQLFIPTLREAPADAEVASHKLLLRAGYIRQLGAGLYSYLFLGNRCMKKIEAIVREEMDTIGQELFLPALNPREAWEASGRWAGMGDNMFRLKDRKGAELCLAMTHEEIVTGIAKSELRSYKQLPQIWYQIQTKFRDEPRPKSGLLRVRQFLMKDAYSFDLDEAGLDLSYQKHDEAYRRIFSRCGLEFVAVEADSGSMGGSQSQEFMVYTEAGEDLIASCPTCTYAANLEKATSTLGPVEDLAPTGDGTPELVSTPNCRTIPEVSAFLGVEQVHLVKTMALIVEINAGNEVDRLPLVVLLRGDHQLNEAKLALTMPAFLATPKSPIDAKEFRDLRSMTDEELQTVFGGPAGYLGPLGIDSTLDLDSFWTAGTYSSPKPKKALVILDKTLEGRSNLITGANQVGYHYRNITPGRDFTPILIADVRNINKGDPCPLDDSPLRLDKAVEIGHIFKLGYKYTESLRATVLDRDGKERNPIMGSYGIGLERILTAAIETSAAKHAGEAYALPPAIAPFQVVVTVTNVKDATLLAAGERIAQDLTAAGIDTLLDDRDERAGVKFKDADLIGIPFRINVGRGAAEGPHAKTVEFVDRLAATTLDIALDQVATVLQQALPPKRRATF